MKNPTNKPITRSKNTAIAKVTCPIKTRRDDFRRHCCGQDANSVLCQTSAFFAKGCTKELDLDNVYAFIAQWQVDKRLGLGGLSIICHAAHNLENLNIQRLSDIPVSVDKDNLLKAMVLLSEIQTQAASQLAELTRQEVCVNRNCPKRVTVAGAINE